MTSLPNVALTIPAKPKPQIKTVDLAFAHLSLLLAYLFVKNGLFSAPGAGFTGFALLFVAASLAYAKIKTGRLTAPAYTGAVLISAFSLVFILSDNGYLKTWALLFECIGVLYWYFRMFGEREDTRVDDLFPFKLVKSVLAIPFGHVDKFFRVLVNGIKDKRGLKRLGFIALGLLIALIPSAVVFGLLNSADQAFSNLTDRLFSDFAVIIESNAAPAILTIPVAVFLFAMMYANSEKLAGKLLPREKSEKLLKSARCLSPLIVCSALTPLLLIYLLFFISQSAYFLSGFSSITPGGFIPSEYARRGFFELCAVSAINAAVIALTLLLAKRGEDGRPNPSSRIYVAVFSFFTLALIATALSKMALYVDNFGLTLKRVYASWFMLLLAVFFILLVVKQFWRRLNFFLCAAVAFALLFGGLCFCDVDGRIARYNVDKYLSGELSELDVDMMDRELSSSAIPCLLDAYDRLPEDARRQVGVLLSHKAEYFNLSSDSAFSYRSYNLPAARAAKLLRQKGLVSSRIFGWGW